MSTAVNTLNRTVLTVLALILLAGAVLGLLLSAGTFGADRAANPTLSAQARTFAEDNWWFWWAVAAACLLLALLGLRWLIAQLSTDRVGRLDLTTDERDGLTIVHAGAVAHAVEQEATAIRGVAGASAHLERKGRNSLYLTVELTDYADIAEVSSEIERRTVANTRQALDDPNLPVNIELKPTKTRSSNRGLS